MKIMKTIFFNITNISSIETATEINYQQEVQACVDIFRALFLNKLLYYQESRQEDQKIRKNSPFFPYSKFKPCCNKLFDGRSYKLGQRYFCTCSQIIYYSTGKVATKKMQLQLSFLFSTSICICLFHPILYFYGFSHYVNLSCLFLINLQQ